MCSIGGCPAVFRVLAAEACAWGTCPTVATDGKSLIIIGKAVTQEDFPELAGRIGADERAVAISPDLIRKALGVELNGEQG